jgi:hypothetical protein
MYSRPVGYEVVKGRDLVAAFDGSATPRRLAGCCSTRPMGD